MEGNAVKTKEGKTGCREEKEMRTMARKKVIREEDRKEKESKGPTGIKDKGKEKRRKR